MISPCHNHNPRTFIPVTHPPIPMSFLIIQTAFIGDVILATPLIEKLHRFYPDVPIDFLLRKGNESLLEGHPFVRKVWVWDKKKGKYRHLSHIARQIRRERYDWVINCQRFGASGLLTASAGGRHTVGFDKNPFSLLFTKRVPHQLDGRHEVSRNLELIAHLTDAPVAERPRLYPGEKDREMALSVRPQGPYVCIAPTSVWFTKQFPMHQWAKLIDRIPEKTTVCLLGAPSDVHACDQLIAMCHRGTVLNLAGKLSLLASAALMETADMCYVNDSAPLHLASAVNAPTCAVFCSTVPDFGFGPLSDVQQVVQILEKLDCRPCGLHGFNRCPKGHFRCAEAIDPADIPFPKC